MVIFITSALWASPGRGSSFRMPWWGSTFLLPTSRHCQFLVRLTPLVLRSSWNCALALFFGSVGKLPLVGFNYLVFAKSLFRVSNPILKHCSAQSANRCAGLLSLNNTASLDTSHAKTLVMKDSLVAFSRGVHIQATTQNWMLTWKERSKVPWPKLPNRFPHFLSGSRSRSVTRRKSCDAKAVRLRVMWTKSHKNVLCQGIWNRWISSWTVCVS